jgi:hypothetical protein
MNRNADSVPTDRPKHRREQLKRDPLLLSPAAIAGSPEATQDAAFDASATLYSFLHKT